MRGGNKGAVFFDGVAFDNEEGHHPSDPGNCGWDSATRGPWADNATAFGWKCPMGPEVRTSAAGIAFLADIIAKVCITGIIVGTTCINC